MKADWTCKAEKAWLKYVSPRAEGKPYWIENSSKISNQICLSNRELFALIILAHMKNVTGGQWRVGCNASDKEPHDGFVINGKCKVHVEHKVVAQCDGREVLKAIIETYEKTEAKGSDYGKGRVLIIQPNKAPDHGGLIKISDLTECVGEKSPFDQVLTLAMVCKKEHNNIGCFHLVQHYPPRNKSSLSGNGIIQIDFNFSSGQATIPYSGFVIG